MQLVNAWKTVVLGNYATFSGRARRSEYWWFALTGVIVSIVLNVVGSISDGLNAVTGLVALVYWLGTLIPSLAVAIRRLHDTGRSGWMLLIGLIPLVGVIILIVFLASDSAKGSNTYGASPKYPG
ncbi:MAG: DUF805 domain-containing protein [Acidobacteria bacterium]|nr:DUF805 domain-containing protein [Acidobacteriota bacterium]